MGFFKNIASKAFNKARTVKNNVGYNMSYMAERKIHIKSPAGYTNRGTYKPTEKALIYAVKNYKRDGYSVITMPAVNGYNEKVLVLYVKKAKAAPVRKITGRVKASARTKRVTKAKKTIPKYLEIAGKRYEKAGSFGSYQDNARAYASDLKRKGFSARVKKFIVNSEAVFTVYTRNPPRGRRA